HRAPHLGRAAIESRNPEGDNSFLAAQKCPDRRYQRRCCRWASRMAIHTRSGVAGMSTWSILYSRQRPSTMALTTAGQEPIAPASPAPFTPSGLVVQGALWVSKWNEGPSAARGSA